MTTSTGDASAQRASATGVLRGADETRGPAAEPGSYHTIASEALYAVCWRAAWGRGEISKRALEVWCALREVEASQRAWGAGRNGSASARGKPHCTLAKLAGLTQRSEAEVRAALRILEGSGLILWSPQRTLFLGRQSIPIEGGERERFVAMLERTRRAQDGIPLSRVLLRSLARSTTHSLLIAACVAALRCAYTQADGVNLRGSVTARWVQELFGLARSTWRAALAELEQRGLLLREQYRSREHRSAYGQILDLRAYGPGSYRGPRDRKKFGGGEEAEAENSGGLRANHKLLFSDQNLKREVLKNPPPPPTAPTPGVSKPIPEAKPSQATPPSGPATSREVLTDLAALERRWQEYLAERGPQNRRGERDWIEFVALAQHALRITREQGGDAAALFASNLRHRRFAHIAQCDEERALELVRRRSQAPIDLSRQQLPPPVAALLDQLQHALVASPPSPSAERETRTVFPVAVCPERATPAGSRASGTGTPRACLADPIARTQQETARPCASAHGQPEPLPNAPLPPQLERASWSEKASGARPAAPSGANAKCGWEERELEGIALGCSAAPSVVAAEAVCPVNGVVNLHPSRSTAGARSQASARVREFPGLVQLLCAAVGSRAYRAWFAELEACEGPAGRWRIHCLDAFTRSWLERRYGGELSALTAGGVVRIE